MPDVLTPADLAAIAAFPPERVQVIPRGTVALTYGEYVYDPAYPGDGLRPVTPYDWKRRVSAEVAQVRKGRRKKRRERAAEASAKGLAQRRLLKWDRQQQVREMTLARCTAETIAKAMSISVSTVKNDRRDLVASGALPAVLAGRKG